MLHTRNKYFHELSKSFQFQIKADYMYRILRYGRFIVTIARMAILSSLHSRYIH